jgi:CRP-like cAMP-binding protein
VDVRRLTAWPFLGAVPEPELDAIAAVAKEHMVDVGEPLTTEGDFGHCLFLIESGTAVVTIDGAAVRGVGPGDVVGEVAVLASGRRTATVVATSPMRTIAIFKRDVWALERRAPTAARLLREALEAHLGSALTPAD